MLGEAWGDQVAHSVRGLGEGENKRYTWFWGGFGVEGRLENAPLT